MRSHSRSVVKRTKRESLETTGKISPGGDLWRHAPVRDTEGRSLSDLMVLLPGIQRGGAAAVLIRRQLQDVLAGFGDRIRFADLNIHLGVLWVSVNSDPGLCREVADAIRGRIEGARLVCNYTSAPEPVKLTWTKRVRRLLK